MDATKANTNSFEPLSDFVQEGDCDTLLVYLPGFAREQLRVQLARSGVLKISGTRPIGDKAWSSFQKEFRVSANCDTSKITAKFEEGILYVRQPKVIVPAQEEEKRHPVEGKEKSSDQLPEVTNTLDEGKGNAPEAAVVTRGEAEAGKGNGVGGGGEMVGVKRREPAKGLTAGWLRMTVVLVALVAVALGVWIKNRRGWVSYPAGGSEIYNEVD